MNFLLTPRNMFVTALLVVLALIPAYSALVGSTFLMSFFTRILIFGMEIGRAHV